MFAHAFQGFVKGYIFLKVEGYMYNRLILLNVCVYVCVRMRVPACAWCVCPWQSTRFDHSIRPDQR